MATKKKRTGTTTINKTMWLTASATPNCLLAFYQMVPPKWDAEMFVYRGVNPSSVPRLFLAGCKKALPEHGSRDLVVMTIIVKRSPFQPHVEETRCLNCGTKLTTNGKRLQSAVFDSNLPVPIMLVSGTSATWARCDACYEVARRREG